MSNRYAIEAKGLAREYALPDGEVIQAVRGIDLTVEHGEIYILLGPNGAGKTTTFSMLTTLLLPTGGWARVAGFDIVQEPAQVRRNIGVTFQDIVLDQELTGKQVLDFHARLYGQSRTRRDQRIRQLSELVELGDALNRKVSTYSGGMKRRLELARGLMTSPDILFLDEPTQGLDPQNRAGIWRYIRRLRNEEGLTLLMTTHYMEEAEALADRVGIIDGGRLIIEGAPRALVQQMGADVVSITGHGAASHFEDRARAEAFVTQLYRHQENGNDHFQIGVDSGDRRLARLIEVASSVNFKIGEVSVSRPSLGDVFLAYTGNALRDT